MPRELGPDAEAVRHWHSGHPESLPSVLLSVLNSILAAYSQAYVLVLGVCYKLQTFLYLSVRGLIQGIRPLIEYNCGAGEYKRVRKIYSVSLLLTVAIMLFGTLLCRAFLDKLIGLFASGEETIRIGATALRIISAGFVVSSISVVFSGALEGLGKSGPSLVVSPVPVPGGHYPRRLCAQPRRGARRRVARVLGD